MSIKPLTEQELAAVHKFVSRNAAPGFIGAVYHLLAHFHIAKREAPEGLARTLIACFLKPTLQKLVCPET
jgi:hypothetical protein